ncbi:MAG: response regulator transcription factor [Candidatus Bipolaricaulia bacterium]
MIRVLLADDHHLVRQALHALLDKAEDIEVVGEAHDGKHAVKLARQLAPDIVVMDIAMPTINGIEATHQLQRLHGPPRVIILSMHHDEMLIRRALRSGARGYLLKSSVSEELLIAVRAAMRNETYLSPAISTKVIDDLLIAQPADADKDAFDRLTPREREVLQLVAEGHTNIEISRLLSISVKTVEKHRAHLMSKLDIHDIAGLVRLAVRRKLIFLSE